MVAAFLSFYCLFKNKLANQSIFNVDIINGELKKCLSTRSFFLM